MGNEETEHDEEISKMFADNKDNFSSDELLSLHILHKFNIDLETMQSMPAFDSTLKPLFSQEKEK